MRNRYIVEEVESIEEALVNLMAVIHPSSEEIWSVWLEHGLVLATEEVDETH